MNLGLVTLGLSNRWSRCNTSFITESKRGNKVMYDYEDRINHAVFPCLQGTIAGIAVALKQGIDESKVEKKRSWNMLSLQPTKTQSVGTSLSWGIRLGNRML